MGDRPPCRPMTLLGIRLNADRDSRLAAPALATAKPTIVITENTSSVEGIRIEETLVNAKGGIDALDFSAENILIISTETAALLLWPLTI